MLSMKRKFSSKEGLAGLCEHSKRKSQVKCLLLVAGFALASAISLFLLLCPMEPRYTRVCTYYHWRDDGFKTDVFPCSSNMVYTPEAISKQVSWYDSFWPLVFKSSAR